MAGRVEPGLRRRRRERIFHGKEDTMTSRERIRRIIAGEPADRCGFWLGNPHGDTWPILHEYFGTSTEEELRRLLQDDFRWIPAGHFHDPNGKGMFHIPNRTSHGSAGPFAESETVSDLDAYDWPRLEYLDFEPTLEALRNAGDYYRASGLWTCFYHNVMDLFGMESYMINMKINPDLVRAVTDRVCEFYYEANERFFALAGDLVDGFFLGNDFGTQLDLICGPEEFREFILPWFQRFIDQGHRFGYQTILHSCGSIHRVIERLIEAGVDCLHPLQAKAKNMDAEILARDFKGRIAFMGGVDTQDLLVNASPEAVKAETHRVMALLEPRLIVSPSHEAILPNVPPANIRAMAEATLEPS
jgi:uroporphyrinogen decarboxylase